MNVKETVIPFPSERRERLVLKLHPKRVSLIFFYVFSVIMIIIGVSFMAATAYGSIPRNLLAWEVGSSAIIIGIILFTWTEIRREFKLYIITTWNVRVRTGIFRKRTTRIFYDEISECNTSINPEVKNIGMGDVRIYSSKDPNKPTLVFEEVENPDGIREIISRFKQSITEPLPWGHLSRK